MRKYIKQTMYLAIIISVLSSCTQERLDPILTAVDGGGTLDEYVAYTINSEDPMGTNVYGRVVFWKTDLDQTLVQVSLYNTTDDTSLPTLILEGMTGVGTTTLMTLDDIDGSLGEFSDKFFAIEDTDFYDTLEGTDDIMASYDAHISIYDEDGITILASGDIGTNADPVESN